MALKTLNALNHAVTRYMNRYVVDGIQSINEKPGRIAEGTQNADARRQGLTDGKICTIIYDIQSERRRRRERMFQCVPVRRHRREI